MFQIASEEIPQWYMDMQHRNAMQQLHEGHTPHLQQADRIAALERRVAELEKRLANEVSGQ